VGRAISVGFGTTIALSIISAAAEPEGRKHMPVARLRWDKFVAGVLLASTVTGLGLVPYHSASAAPFSGTYIGTTQLITGSARSIPGDDPECAPGGQIALQVQDGRFVLPWHDPQQFHVTITSNGSFYATSGIAPALAEKRMTIVPTIEGHATGAIIEADYGTRWCRYHLEATR
jgi:hypothetical protein